MLSSLSEREIQDKEALYPKSAITTFVEHISAATHFWGP